MQGVAGSNPASPTKLHALSRIEGKQPMSTPINSDDDLRALMKASETASPDSRWLPDMAAELLASRERIGHLERTLRNVRAYIAECDHEPAVDEIDSALFEPKVTWFSGGPCQPTNTVPVLEWRCYWCGSTFQDRAKAEIHFGSPHGAKSAPECLALARREAADWKAQAEHLQQIIIGPGDDE